MSDTYEHNRNDHEDPLPGPIWMVGFISAVLLIVIVFGITSLFYRAEELEATAKLDVIEKDEKQRKKVDLVKLEQMQIRTLTAPARNIKAMAGMQLVEERFVIPIDDAMQLIVEEYGR